MDIQIATKRIFLTILIVSLAGSALLAILGILRVFRSFDEQFMATSLFCALYSLVALMCAIPFDRARWRVMSGGGIVLTLTSFALVIPAVWIPALERSEDYVKTAAVIGILGFCAGQASLVSLARLGNGLRWLQLLTYFAIGGSGLGLSIFLIFEPRYPYEWWFAAIGIAMVLNGFGSIALLLLHILYRIRKAEQIETTDVTLSMVCPRCRQQQTVPSGNSTCPNCKLRFKIEIEEPRCDKCGYLLYQLNEPRCPECGKPFD